MRLATSNIKFVKLHERDGVAYNWFVKLYDNDARQYQNYDANGRSALGEYKFDELPKSVRDFIVGSQCELQYLDTYADGSYATYIYRR